MRGGIIVNIGSKGKDVKSIRGTYLDCIRSSSDALGLVSELFKGSPSLAMFSSDHCAPELFGLVCLVFVFPE